MIMSRNQNGFSLIEVIIALGLIGLVSIGFIMMFSTGFRFIMMSSAKTESLFSIQEVAENSYAMGIGQVSDQVSIKFPSKSPIIVKGTLKPIEDPRDDTSMQFKPDTQIIAFFPVERYAQNLIDLSVNYLGTDLITDFEPYIYKYDISERKITVTVNAVPDDGYYVEIFLDSVKQLSNTFYLGNTWKEITISVIDLDDNGIPGETYDDGYISKPINYRIFRN